MQSTSHLTSIQDHARAFAQLASKIMQNYALYSSELQLSITAFSLRFDRDSFYELHGKEYRIGQTVPIQAIFNLPESKTTLTVNLGKKIVISLAKFLQMLTNESISQNDQFSLPHGLEKLRMHLFKKIAEEHAAREAAELQKAVNLSLQEKRAAEKASDVIRKQNFLTHCLAYHKFFFNGRLPPFTIIPGPKIRGFINGVQESIDSETYALEDGNHPFLYDAHYEAYIKFLKQNLQFHIAHLFDTARSEKTKGSYSSYYFKPTSKDPALAKQEALVAVCTTLEGDSMSFSQILSLNHATHEDVAYVQEALKQCQNKNLRDLVQAECEAYLKILKSKAATTTKSK